MVIIKGEKYMILPKGFWHKKSIFFVILLFFFSIFSSSVYSYDSTTLSFEDGMDDEDGVYYTSSFSDVESYFGGCVYSNQGNKLILDPEGSRFKNYNFTDWDSDSPHAMYAGDLFWFFQAYQLSWVMSLFEDKVEEEPYYWATSQPDGITYPYDYKVNPSSFQQIHYFRFKITQDITSSSSFNVTWMGEASNFKNVCLYMWKPFYGPLGIWQEIDSSEDNSTSLTLTYENESLSLGSDDYLDVCVVVVPSLGDDCTIQTDYINVKVQGEGYATEGAARFDPVIPDSDKISRWERFIWSGYERPLTSISFQFFHEENGSYSLISDSYIDDNSDGISDKVVDLSSLPVDTNLTVNVSMSTRDLSVSPELYDWGVSWQISDDYWKDLLTTDLRVDASTLRNIRIADGKASLVTTVYDWPMNGQNGQNTRASPGLGPGSYSSLCWEGKEKVGGNQKNPIVNDGVLYIANSISSRIYAYDAQYDISYLPNGFSDFSDNLGYDIINTPVATDKNTIVVATGSSDSGGGIANKVVALNANDLQSQEWMFSFGSVNSDDSSICYEASPVLSRNKIYLTSWNGDTSLLGDVFDFFNLSTGNNKLICLTDEGSYEWSKDLPAGSFASPAVSEELDLVVAGCEKLNGESLFAFTLDGTSLWSADVGPIGYASPVIYDETVYVVSKKTGQNPVTAFTQVVALDSSSGDIKWNTTIGDMVPELYSNAAYSGLAIAEGFLYVASPDGVLCKIDASDGSVVKTNSIWVKGVSSTIVRSSPAYADGMIYIGSPNGYLYAFNADTLEKAWDKKTDPLSPIFSSPVVVDGFVYYVDESYALYCRGKQQISENEQITGELISMPITRPDDMYWGRFDVVDETNSGYIDYSILDEDYNLLVDDVEDNAALTDEDLIDEERIRLKAAFHANAKEEVILNSWKVSFSSESPNAGDTVFQNFEKNLSYPARFSIEVQDEEDGLINTSARFKLEYSNETTGTYETDWLPANVTGENESTDKEIIRVNMSYIDVIDEIDLYHQIKFSINDTKLNTAYSDWYFIEGKPDEQVPLFDMDSFTPDPPYISTMTPTCTIQAIDAGSNGNTTGINVDSAAYSITYKDDGTTKTHTEKASCSGSNGTTNTVTITADISESEVSDQITSIESIKFYIEDMNENSNETDWIDLFFDDTPPSSSITNADDIPEFSTAEFILINASATDAETTGEYASGVKEIKLYYRGGGRSTWTTFDPTCSDDDCSWEFTIGLNDGGEYELCTQAVDNASNQEDLPDEGDVFVTYDPNEPTVSFTDEIIEITDDALLPSFDQVTFEDDYKLGSVYYRLNSESPDNWTLITTTTANQITPTWTLTSTQWNNMIEDEMSYIFFKVVDALGNTFVIDSTSDALRVLKNVENVSEFVLDVSDFGSWQWDNTYKIRVNTQDQNISEMTLWYRFAGDSENTTKNWTKYDNITTSPFEWDFTPEDGEGYYQFYVEVTTSAGVVKETNIETMYVSLFPIMELVVSLIITMILFAVSGLVIKKYRGRQKKGPI